MNAKEWLKDRTRDELLGMFALLRHGKQTDLQAHRYRTMIKEELEVRARRLSEFMGRLDKGA